MSVRWEGDLTANINQFGLKAKRGMVAAANYAAPQIESWMKQNAPWTDQTGAARNGLRADVQTTTNSVAIVIYHSVPYGVFLEVRWGGKYAILRPALAYGTPVFAEALRRLVFDS
jgi:hypothetical protein